MHITFIQTGGTIDKAYPRILKSYGFEIADPAVGRILERVRPNFTVKIVPLLRKDSLDLTDKDRKLIYHACLTELGEKIIITHGTDTMIQTAHVLRSIKNKTIILTGALLPETMRDSDAMFNIGVAIGAVQTLGYGVYVAMSGRIYPWDACKKSEKTCKFIHI